MKNRAILKLSVFDRVPFWGKGFLALISLFFSLKEKKRKIDVMEKTKHSLMLMNDKV